MTFLATALTLSLLMPQSGGPSTPDLVVSSHYWGRVAREITLDGGRTTNTTPWERPRSRRRTAAAPPVKILQRETHALVKNNGSKTIRSVTWSYLFYKDSKHEDLVGRFKFESKEKIGPGEMKFLTEQVKDAAPTVHDEVLIERVDYVDGSSWTRS